jgi:hypothetical protein
MMLITSKMMDTKAHNNPAILSGRRTNGLKNINDAGGYKNPTRAPSTDPYGLPFI